MEPNELMRELKKGLLNWYPFAENSQILWCGDLEDPLCEMLEEKGHKVTVYTEDLEFATYEYVIVTHMIEFQKDITEFLIRCKSYLKKEGILLLATDNRLGIRFFCGDRDPYTGRNFDSVENYRSVAIKDKMPGRLLDKNCLKSALRDAGLVKMQCYSIFPNVDSPQLIYSEDYIPTEDLSMRYIPNYNYPDTVFIEDKFLLESCIKNNLFHALANAFLFECSLEGELANIAHVTLSMDRGENHAMATVIKRDSIVEKKAMHSNGIESLKQLVENHNDLKSHGIKVIDGKLVNDRYVMPYINADIAMVYLQNLLRSDMEKFILEVDRLRDIVLQSSEHVPPVLSEYERAEVVKEIPIDQGIWLKRGYFDLVPLNAFYQNGDYIFFDQEFYIDNYPANAMIIRMVDVIYGRHTDLEEILPKNFFWERYKVEKVVSYYQKKSHEYLCNIRKQRELRIYNELHQLKGDVLNSNRQRMNFSADEYQNLFVNIFENLENYKLFLFGSGNFAKKFVDLYGSRYRIEAILDNNASRWGEEMNGVPICSPEVLDKMEKENCKVIICIKSYLGVWKQLKDMNVKNIGIYDVNIIYPAVKTVQLPAIKEDTDVQKKYKVGYVAGVFDLYHIGHLNMFKRAKEQCEYLIVGVVSDESVRKNKKTVPFIPFEERIEMVRSCKYVDEAVEIPPNFGGTRDAYRLYHFDVQFSGSDYENDPGWLAEREYLRKHGSDLVFFPYTEQTSSTKIKALINKQLEEK